MDYQIVDGVTDPQPAASDFHREHFLRIDPVFSVYMPDSGLPDVALETPASNAGFITFGSFNSMPKLNPLLLKLWGRILAQVEGSKLLVKNKMLDYPSVRRDLS